MKSSKTWIDRLGLIAHPEGGYFKEVYRSDEQIPATSLPERYGEKRTYATSIYFLLDKEQYSAWHKLQSDEIWHHNYGSSLYIHVIDPKGKYYKFTLGTDIEKDESPQLVIPRGHWFAAEVADKRSYTLISCTVAPGFEFDDFELADKNELANRYPEHEEIINRLVIK